MDSDASELFSPVITRDVTPSHRQRSFTDDSSLTYIKVLILYVKNNLSVPVIHSQSGHQRARHISDLWY